MTVYYAHFMGIYNTPQEKRDIETLENLGLQVLNPNTPEIQKQVDEYKGFFSNEKTQYDLMFDAVFLSKVRDCQVFAFRALPDGRIPKGVHRELVEAQNHKKIIIELPCGTLARGMDGEATREYLRDIGQR